MEERKSDGAVMLKEALILTVITLLSGLLLGYVHELTKKPIEEQRELAIQNACAAVFSNVQDVAFLQIQDSPSPLLEEELTAQGVTIGKIYRAFEGEGDPAGYVIESTSSEGYGGKIVLYVGITEEGKLNDVSILSISETPGLGMRAEEVLVPQLHDMEVDQIQYTKTGKSAENEIDAISGATITTKAVTAAVNGALKMAKELRGGDGDE